MLWNWKSVESISKTIPIPRFFILLFVTAYNIRNILFCCLLVLNEIKRKIHFCAMFYKLDLVKPSLFIDHFIFIVFLIFLFCIFSQDSFYENCSFIFGLQCLLITLDIKEILNVLYTIIHYQMFISLLCNFIALFFV